ncbi:transcription factor IIIA-like [Dreissena polymorpha]|uniref:transcription factor IIIA-like n=1 Tax=Dreissena polymorpha TaxID=45954 RepID=UPI002264BAEA|nr:transcription factor IIIA-like [Dreissena polymorpha]
MDDDKRFTCSECNKTFKKRSRLEIHSRSHTGERPYVCDFEGCNNSYKRVDHLRRHEYTTHKPQNAVDIRCEESDCEAQFSSWDNLNKHIKRCHEKQVYTCHIAGCKAEFRKHRLLKEHKLEVHSQGAKYLCQEPGCGKSFSLGHQYRRHMKTHEGYICSECNEKFDKWSLLLKHRKRQHLKSCVHRCDKCQKSFAQKQWLTQHMVVHEAFRTVVVCPYENCNREYLDQRNLNAHVRSYHEGKKFSCDHDGCNRSFATKQKLQLHQNIHDPNRPLPKKPKPKTTAAKLTGIRNCSHNTNASCSQASLSSPVREDRIDLHDIDQLHELSDLQAAQAGKDGVVVNSYGLKEIYRTSEEMMDTIYEEASKKAKLLQTAINEEEQTVKELNQSSGNTDLD